jgi:hypothetical protein
MCYETKMLIMTFISTIFIGSNLTISILNYKNMKDKDKKNGTD